MVILESTSPVGTTEMLRDRLAALRLDLAMPGLTAGAPDVAIAYCPERVLPGRILEELIQNDRSIGGITPRCAREALAFYKLFVRGACVTTDVKSAEMTKLVENAYRDVNIAFANELSMIADRMGLDVWEGDHLTFSPNGIKYMRNICRKGARSHTFSYTEAPSRPLISPPIP